MTSSQKGRNCFFFFLSSDPTASLGGELLRNWYDSLLLATHYFSRLPLHSAGVGRGGAARTAASPRRGSRRPPRGRARPARAAPPPWHPRAAGPPRSPRPPCPGPVSLSLFFFTKFSQALPPLLAPVPRFLHQTVRSKFTDFLVLEPISWKAGQIVFRHQKSV